MDGEDVVEEGYIMKDKAVGKGDKKRRRDREKEK